VLKYIDKPLIKYNVYDNSLSSEISRLCLTELHSEFRARNKHIKLLKRNRKGNPLLVQNFIIKRYKHIVRESFAEKNILRFYFLRKLILSQFKIKDFYGLK